MLIGHDQTENIGTYGLITAVWAERVFNFFFFNLFYLVPTKFTQKEKDMYVIPVDDTASYTFLSNIGSSGEWCTFIFYKVKVSVNKLTSIFCPYCFQTVEDPDVWSDGVMIDFTYTFSFCHMYFLIRATWVLESILIQPASHQFSYMKDTIHSHTLTQRPF